jgi:lysophospholipase L1-like esterase
MRSLSLLLLLFLFSGIAAAREPVTVYLAGDSTMAPKLPEKRPETGWGEQLQQFFKEGSVKIDNRARNGRSTRTFIEEGHWQRIIENLKKGDYVFIQFGHNDSARDKPERYTPPEDYRRNLSRFITEALEKGATPVLLTPVMRRRFDKDGTFRDVHGVYPDIVREVAAAHKVALIDMHRKSEQLIKQYGVEESRKLFLQLKPGENSNYPKGVEDNTHFSPLGAQLVARLAVEGIREQKIGLAKHLKKTDAQIKRAPVIDTDVMTKKQLDPIM